jgi:hypothetical protein
VPQVSAGRLTLLSFSCYEAQKEIQFSQSPALGISVLRKGQTNGKGSLEFWLFCLVVLRTKHHVLITAPNP